jgi:hypothetical protein
MSSLISCYSLLINKTLDENIKMQETIKHLIKDSENKEELLKLLASMNKRTNELQKCREMFNKL